MLKSDLVETDKHSRIILLRRKNLRFLRVGNKRISNPKINLTLNLK